jgi:hypothetical protein
LTEQAPGDAVATTSLAIQSLPTSDLGSADLAMPGLENIRTFLSVIATELHETILRLERTTARVTELTALRAARPERDLVVALQDFDRLQQEFVSFADAIASAAVKSSQSWQPVATGRHPAEDAVAKIPLTDLKTRILRQLGGADEGFVEVIF